MRLTYSQGMPFESQLMLVRWGRGRGRGGEMLGEVGWRARTGLLRARGGIRLGAVDDQAHDPRVRDGAARDGVYEGLEVGPVARGHDEDPAGVLGRHACGVCWGLSGLEGNWAEGRLSHSHEFAMSELHVRAVLRRLTVT